MGNSGDWFYWASHVVVVTPAIPPTPAQTNHVVVKIDGVAVTDEDFSTSFSHHYTFDQTVTHHWEVIVTPWNTGVDDAFDRSGDTVACVPMPSTVPDATAGIHVEQPTCSEAGHADVVDLGHASLVGTLDESVGTHIAAFIADVGHTFADGHATKALSYTIAAVLPEDSDQCAPPPTPDDATAAVTITPATCDAAGSAAVSGLDFAFLVGTLDETPGTHTATFDAISGHRFGNDASIISVSYTVPDKLTGDQCETPPAPIQHSSERVTTPNCSAYDVVTTHETWTTNFVLEDGVFVGVDTPHVVVTDSTVGMTPAQIDACFGSTLPGSAQAVCVGDIPHLSWAIQLPEGYDPAKDPNVVDPTRPVTISVADTHGHSFTLPGTYPLTGTTLWPGASDTPPLTWPGWQTNADGTYTNIGDGNFGWTRAATGVTWTYTIDPTFTTTTAYPAETSTCANPPQPTPASVPVTPVSSTQTLAHTGSDVSSSWMVVGAGALASGIIIMISLGIARRRKA
jgi:hypothetical protein